MSEKIYRRDPNTSSYLPDMVNNELAIFSGSIFSQYDDIDELEDIGIKRLRSFLKKHPFLRVEKKHFLPPNGKYCHVRPDDFEGAAKIREEIDILFHHRAEKIERINACLEIMEKCKSIIEFKQAQNEISRALTGNKDDLTFPEKKYDPDLLFPENK